MPFFIAKISFFLKTDCKDTEMRRQCKKRREILEIKTVLFPYFVSRKGINFRTQLPDFLKHPRSASLYISLFFLLIISDLANAQSNFAPLNEDYYHWIDRYEVKTARLSDAIFTSVKPYQRSAIIQFVDSVSALGGFTSRADEFNRDYLQIDSWEWSKTEKSNSRRARRIYGKKSDFIHVNHPDLDLHVNPVIMWGLGQDSRNPERLFINTRGVEVRGMVDKKVGFYTYLAENQTMLPSYVNDFKAQFGVVPHEGFWKEYKEGNGVDFFQARGYFTFDATRHINLQFGHDRFFIGNGQRSLIYSDFQPPALFLKGNVKVWKLNYFFLINQLTADIRAVGNTLLGTESYPQKFSATHHLSLNLGKRFNIGFFESVVFGASDTTGATRFRFDYLNPVIFYRAIEQQNGSSDNVLLGMDFKWLAFRKLSFYGQFVLDEFKIDNIRAQNGWWANKFAVQAGGKYVDAFGVPNLDLQGEVNIVRPFTYSHNSAFGSYSNYRQSMAHPLGANFQEVLGILRYQPMGRLNVVAKLSVTQVGRDSVNANWGNNILLRNTTREKEFGNTIGQGSRNTITFGSFTMSYQLLHNMFVDGNVIVRTSQSDWSRFNKNTMAVSMVLRWNIPQRLYEF